ncbi:phage regulatory CII family protein [Chitinilyticum aquatile]|uniref:phage regulatory CII family protein n=1 Tax=Chitinilyticum aquatile TaxID=362520 RepID=UPI00041A1648|nr:phage regulatory CII family protein [Chitinilyticum aquatile]
MSLKLAMYATVHDFKGGAEALAPMLGCGVSTLRNKVNPNLDTHHLTVEEADKLMAATGQHWILHALASRHGYVAVPNVENAPASDLAVLELVTKVWRANGDVGAAVDDALSDGKIEPHEVKRVRGEVYRVQAALHELLLRLEGMSE